MTLLQQLGWGSLYLTFCLLIETAIIVTCISSLEGLTNWLKNKRQVFVNTVVLLISVGFILLSHTVQIWIWATVFIWTNALPDWNTSIYFSLITYTSLGYGDVVLGEGLRVFGGFAAITGLLGFGISTAFVVTVVGRIFRIYHNHPLGRE
ncbi:MAG: ion channel [Paracoccaceae bacterium]|jgi:hypothetical protein